MTGIEEEIKAKIEMLGTPLKGWDIQINYGIKTGFNEAFIIDEHKKAELIEKSPESAEIIRPIIRGRDIKKYTIDFANKWLIYVPWHFPLQNDDNVKGNSIEAEKQFANRYSNIYNHLNTFKGTLEKRNQAETGIRYEWYALQRCAATYFDEFQKDKIVYIDIMTDNEVDGYEFPSFSYSENGELLLNTAYFITADTKVLKYLLAILNSRVGKFLIKNYTSQLQQRQYRMFSQYVVNFPIPPIVKNTPDFESLINKVLSSKKEKMDTKCIEDEINNLVYDLYDLTENEREYFNNIR
ncbi:TaqI-like C-terminal specificity domain-containing protein [Mucilaginibacter sp. 3215]|uniref:TaqI-like C-terminal specificity domain-containing protein n=1 Tax=Mucilaginibacter sp. 3215 TaxID=3373912 RepID=UPI003D1B0DAA